MEVVDLVKLEVDCVALALDVVLVCELVRLLVVLAEVVVEKVEIEQMLVSVSNCSLLLPWSLQSAEDTLRTSLSSGAVQEGSTMSCTGASNYAAAEKPDTYEAGFSTDLAQSTHNKYRTFTMNDC